MELAHGWCSKCAIVVDFERPVCDDHTGDCPELACSLCGAGYVGGAYHAPAVRTTPARAVVTPAA